MTRERWRRLEELFTQADALPAADRTRFLTAECADDPELIVEVVELLGYGPDGSLARIVGDQARQFETDAFALPARLQDRFQIRHRLGSGGMGVVFEAYDERRGELVALKALPHREPQHIEALKQEFRVLANVSHPCLIRLHELFTDGEHWFFTMQKIEGSELLAHVRPDGVLDEPALRRVLADLIDGVRAIHRADRLHRDLKPSNVLVAGGRAVILDFGLARAAGVATAEIAGTPEYMAPEAFAGRPSVASDWYALGVVLFEALTGIRPTRAARDPQVVAVVPADLGRLARDLLDAEPAVRLAAIAAFAGESHDLAVDDERQLPFVGRQPELEALAQAYRDVRDQRRPMLVRVEGVSGMGKSTLVSQFLKTLDDAVVLSGRCYERENVPFKALDAVIDALSANLLAAPRSPVPLHAGDLCRIFPSLGRVFAGSVTADTRLARQRATAALVEVFAMVASARQLVISIDDLQWGDVDSGAMIDALLGAAVPVLWIVAYRPDERCDLADTLAPHRSIRIALEGLDADESARLVGEIDGARDAQVVRSIIDEAGGNPFFLAQLTRGADAFPVGRVELAVLVRARVAMLDPAARRQLEVIALAGAPLAIDAASRAANLADDAAIPSLRAGSWVRTSHATGRGVAEPYHDRIRAAVVEGLDPVTRTELHGRLALELERDAATPELVALHFREAGNRDRAGHHTIAAAENATRALAFDRAASLYRDALDLVGPRRELATALGDALANAGRGPDAAQSYLRAAQLADATEALELERRAAHQYFSTGHVIEGQRVGHDVMSRLGLWIPEHPRAAQLVGLARFAALLLRGFRPPNHTIDNALALRRYDVTNELFQSLASFEPMHGLYFAASAALRGVDLADPLRRADAVGNAAAILTLVRGRSGGAATRWLRAQREVATVVNTPASLGVASTYDGVCATYIGAWASATEHLTQAERLLSTCEGPSYRYQLATGQAIDSWVLFFRGRYSELARRTSRRLEEALGKGNRMAASAQTTHTAIAAPLARDDVATARRFLDEAVLRLPATTYSQMHTWILIAHSLYSLYAGDPLEGHARLVDELPRLRRSQLLSVKIARVQFLWIASSLCAAASRASTGASAARLSRQALAYARQLARVPIGGAVPWSLLCRAALASRAERPELLARARTEFLRHDMLGFAAAAAWHLGDAARADAKAYLTEQGVVRPDRFVAMLAGGFTGAD